jgi:hypothetical protein
MTLWASAANASEIRSKSKDYLFKFFVEGAINRSKVYFRFMLVKMAKGDTLNRTNLFKGIAGNKMIDQINTERFTIVAQKIINVTPPNPGAASLTALTGGVISATRVGRGAGAPGSRGAEKERPRRGRGAEQKSRGR